VQLNVLGEIRAQIQHTGNRRKKKLGMKMPEDGKDLDTLCVKRNVSIFTDSRP
jgi:hypothetical protein